MESWIRSLVAVFALAFLVPTAQAVTYTVDGALPNGGDCGSIGVWTPGLCQVVDLTLEDGEDLQVAAGTTIEFIGALYLNVSSLTVYGTMINRGNFVNYGTASNAGNWYNGPGAIIVNVFSVNNFGMIVNEGEIDNQDILTTIRNNGTIVNRATIRNRGELTNNGTLLNHCDAAVTDDPVTGNPPVGSVSLDVQRDSLAWCAAPDATGYDIIRGDLGTLRVDGNFFLATEDCLASNHAATSLSSAENPALDETPNPGDCFWFLTRPATGNGTYDSAGTGQVAARDDEISTSVAACP